MKKLITIALIAFTFLAFNKAADAAYAPEPDCTIIYGGGAGNCLRLERTIPKSQTGGSVMNPPKMTQTPATGPEMLSLMGLIPAAGLGFLLRRKSK